MKVSKAAKRRAKRGFYSSPVTVVERSPEDLERDPEMAAKIKRAREYAARTQDNNADDVHPWCNDCLTIAQPLSNPFITHSRHQKKEECDEMSLLWSGRVSARHPGLPYSFGGKTITIEAVTGEFCPACGECVFDLRESRRVNQTMLQLRNETPTV